MFQCPLKPESEPALAALAASAHQLVMITGDAPLTACYAAARVHIVTRGVVVLGHVAEDKGHAGGSHGKTEVRGPVVRGRCHAAWYGLHGQCGLVQGCRRQAPAALGGPTLVSATHALLVLDISFTSPLILWPPHNPPPDPNRLLCAKRCQLYCNLYVIDSNPTSSTLPSYPPTTARFRAGLGVLLGLPRRVSGAALQPGRGRHAGGEG